jgi:hypothetical protein
VRTNHELESRQAAALTSGAPAQRVELLRREVRALERDYARAVAALAADTSARR